VALSDRWPLKRGSIHMKFSMKGQEKVTFKYRWLLNGGDRMGRFDCNNDRLILSIGQSDDWFYIYLQPIFCPVIENFIWIEPLLRGHLSYKATFSLSQVWRYISLGLYLGTYRFHYPWSYALLNWEGPWSYGSWIYITTNVVSLNPIQAGCTQ
jgi:hypothetical protein